MQFGVSFEDSTKRLMSDAGENLHDPRLGEVIELLRSGKRIHAVKRYRELTGVDLKQAKEAVERLG
ncbi:hypothetical protein ABZ686_26250 [Streptomyces sp. NPDC006992]|uniref:hypothetical protein n=1 Tax=Streptomyces sp. NPDC006992 TaxID=3155601 RepID=UPI0034103527